jgi:hypothetical protein
MDSMRSLNTSLPRTTPYSQPPEQLLQAFKTAALSVTNLYKSAVADQAQARQAGYQEAIEDLLSFLDRENLGLGDGEGWKVRQWATERADGTAAAGSESDDDEKRARSSSPIVNRKDHPESDRSRQISRSSSPPRGEPVLEHQQQPPIQQEQAATPVQVPATNDSDVFARPPIFTFSAGPQFPQPQSQDIDMQTPDSGTTNSLSQAEMPSALNGPPVSVSVVPRNSRAPHRHNNPSRHTGRSSTREPSTTLGSKRKLHFPDFFDISGLNGRDFFGGGKRGRFA